MGLHANDWSDDDVAKLRKLWDQGLSASQIAAEFNDKYTRSAILGKVSRLKLSPRRCDNARAPADFATPVVPRNRNVNPTKPPQKSFEPKPRRDPSHDIIEQIKINASEPGLAEKYLEPSDGKGITLLELTNASCRWPKGDPLEPGFLFCGDASADLKEGRPYCPFHTLKSIDRTSTVRSARRSKDFEKSVLFAAR
jgi:GcrA cell cycle regulator